MNRRFYCAMALLVLGLAVPAGAQTVLTVGAVRDQHGAPIVGAVASGATASGASLTATTDAAGTFAIRGSVASIRIVCRYCRPLVVTVNGPGPVVAIVWRYDALAHDAPTHDDLENLPYANVESAIALHPFTLLAQSSTPEPGALLSDRGLSSTGSLLIDDGVPNYDIVSGVSPYTLVPAAYEQSATLLGAANAFLYGFPAAGGVVGLDPFVSGSASQVALLGSDAIARAQVGSDAAAIAIGSLSNDEESRQRADVAANWPLGAGETLAVAGGSEQGRDYDSTDSHLAGSFSFGRAAFDDSRLLNLSVTALADRGNYAMEYGDFPVAQAWSDSSISAGVHSDGPVSGFADVAVRSSTGFYDAQELEFSLPRVGAMLAQTRADAGVDASGEDYRVVAGIGTFWIDYAGGTYGVSQPAKVTLAEPSAQAQLFPNGKWSLDLEDSGSFTLPTFFEQYQYGYAEPLPLQYERNALAGAALDYTDQARLRLAFEAASESVQGAHSGTVTSEGVSAIWQLAPAIAVHAWTMHVTNTVPAYENDGPYGTPYELGAPTVGALWLTYDTGNALRIDAIYRRDLLDAAPFFHFDGAISGPISNGLRWYAGTEDRMRRTFVDLGLRFAGR